MTSDEERRRQVLDAQDDESVLTDLQVARLHNELGSLHKEQSLIIAKIAAIQAVLHTSGEARLRKQRRNEKPGNHGTIGPQNLR